MKKKRRAADAAKVQTKPADDAGEVLAPMDTPDVTAVVGPEPVGNDNNVFTDRPPAAQQSDQPASTHAWDDDADRLFFTRGDALEAGELPDDSEGHGQLWREGGGWRGLSLPTLAALAVGVILAGIWLLAR
jgi:hypothetical protein